MPPNLGGFFMVRSYYPSECHADYFDFERIEALKPAIEACGISTLSQSPMLGFHKQMDNRIKLLEEILSFRMQGVEFDNGDMYVDGHKAASDVRDEFVSVTEKLMDELAQCSNVLPQLDINNTIDHRPAGDEKWFLENEKTVTQVCRQLAAGRPLKDIRVAYTYPHNNCTHDERRQRGAPTAVHRADRGVGLEMHVVEEDLVELGVARDLAQSPDRHALRVHRHDEHRQALVLGNVGVGAGQEQPERGELGVCRPHLLARQPPAS